LNQEWAAKASHKYAENVAKEIGLKEKLIAIDLGILVLGIVFGLGLLSLGDIRVMYVVGSVVLMSSAMWLGESVRSGLVHGRTAGFYAFRGVGFAKQFRERIKK
jgi:hypothetical protein